MTPDELYDEFAQGFPARKFSAGLLVAFIDFLDHLNAPALGVENLSEFLEKFPKQAETAAGKRANTLIVAVPSGKTVSLRPFYNAAERYFRAEQKRFDYPSCAPHATQAWIDYKHWLDALVAFSPDQLQGLRERVCHYVLDTLKRPARAWMNSDSRCWRLPTCWKWSSYGTRSNSAPRSVRWSITSSTWKRTRVSPIAWTPFCGKPMRSGARRPKKERKVSRLWGRLSPPQPRLTRRENAVYRETVSTGPAAA